MFVCFEGIDGAGKTTQTRMLHQRLLENGTDAELVADPGTTKIGTAIRQILLHSDEPISAAAQMLLFSAARAELAEYIRARRADGAVVLCDRWLLSTLVYQGEINNISIDLILKIFEETSFIQPDICFLLDISPDDAALRMGAPSDRYERQCMADRQRMRNAYLDHAQHRAHAAEVHIISATKSPQDTHDVVYALFSAARMKKAATMEVI